MKKKFLKYSLSFYVRGVSMASAMMGAALLGISTVGLSTYMGSFQKQQSNYQKQTAQPYHHQELLDSMARIITDTKDPVHSHYNQGFCKLVSDRGEYKGGSVSQLAGNYNLHYVGEVSLSKSDIESGSQFDQARWDRFITLSKKWESASTDECDDTDGKFFGSFTENEFNKCYKSTDSSQGSTDYARLSIVPKNALSLKGLEADRYPVDEIAYELTTTISSRSVSAGETPQWTMTKSKKVIWSDQIKDCTINSGSNYRLVRISGGALGQGLLNQYLFYHARDDAGTSDGACKLDIRPLKKISQGSRMISTGSNTRPSILQNNKKNNAAIGCASNIFSCSQNNLFKAKNVDPEIKGHFSLSLDHSGSAFIKKLDVALAKKGSPDLKNPVFARDAFQYTRVLREDSTGDPADIENWAIGLSAQGSEIVDFYIRNKQTATDEDGLCHNMCSAATGSSGYYPKFTYKLSGGGCNNDKEMDPLDPEVRPVDPEDYEVACTVCYTKSCHRYGMNTFGPATNRPSEPRDGNIPECSLGLSRPGVNLNNQTVTGFDTATVKATSISEVFSDEWKNIPKCIAGNGEPTLCSDSSIDKSLCFVEGEYQVKDGIREEACYNASLEKLKIGDGVSSGLLASMAMAYKVDPDKIYKVLNEYGLEEDRDTYEILNVANQGSFLASASAPTGDYWKNVERDYSGMITHGIPFIPKKLLTLKHNVWGFFYRQPFSSSNFHDVGAKKLEDAQVPTAPGWLTEAEKTAFPDKFKEEFHSRNRPARPVFINFKDLLGDDDDRRAPSSVGSTSSAGAPADAIADIPANAALILQHHMLFKGVYIGTRDIPIRAVCINPSGNPSEVKITSAANTFNSAYEDCKNLGTGFKFIAPTSAGEWATAMLKLAPNEPRYPFPNPFKFRDGIPFIKTGCHGGEECYGYNYDDMPKNEYLLSELTDNLFIFGKNSQSPDPDNKKYLKNEVATAYIGAQVISDNVPWADYNHRASLWTIDSPALYKENQYHVMTNNIKAPAIKNGKPNPYNPYKLVELMTDEEFSLNQQSVKDEDPKNIYIGGFHNGTAVRYFDIMGDSTRGIAKSGPLNPVKELCRVKSDYTDSEHHLAPYSIPGDWDEKEMTCDDDDSLDGSLEEINGYDIFRWSRGLASFRALDKIMNEGGMVINKDKYCKAFSIEKRRRHAARCVAKKYKDSTLTGNLGYDTTKTARDAFKTDACDGNGGILGVPTPSGAITAAKNTAKFRRDTTYNKNDNVSNLQDCTASCGMDRETCVSGKKTACTNKCSETNDYGGWDNEQNCKTYYTPCSCNDDECTVCDVQSDTAQCETNCVTRNQSYKMRECYNQLISEIENSKYQFETDKCNDALGSDMCSTDQPGSYKVTASSWYQGVRCPVDIIYVPAINFNDEKYDQKYWGIGKLNPRTSLKDIDSIPEISDSNKVGIAGKDDGDPTGKNFTKDYKLNGGKGCPSLDPFPNSMNDFELGDGKCEEIYNYDVPNDDGCDSFSIEMGS